MQKQVLFFCHEKLLALYDQSASQRKVLEAEYEDIRGRLETLLEQGAIDEYTKCTIVDMSWRVLENIARDYENVKKGVKSIMGGKVLDYEAKRIKTEGRTEGRREGRREGKKANWRHWLSLSGTIYCPCRRRHPVLTSRKQDFGNLCRTMVNDRYYRV